MPFQHGTSQQVVRIPLRYIEQHYGKDNHDTAGDDIIYCLREASGVDAAYKFVFSADHPNPWYHTMDLIVDRMPYTTYERFIELLNTYGLSED